MRSALAAFCLLLLGFAAPGFAQETQRPQITGLYLMTRYPVLTVTAGEPTTIDLTLHNFGLPPRRLALSVPQSPAGWKATILGGGQPVGAAIVPPEEEVRLQLRLEPPSSVGPGSYRFMVAAIGEPERVELPIEVIVGEELPAKLKLAANFPSLRGTAQSTFKYRLTLNNDSGRDATINLNAGAPPGFEVSFTESYGTQQITGIPLEAGKSKDLDVSVRPPREITAGIYEFVVSAQGEAAAAELKLGLDVIGQPRLALTGEGDRLSADAYAGRETPVTLFVRNIGTEAARNIELSASTPQEWQVTFDPQQIAEIGPDGVQEVKALVSPSERAIAGDYQLSFRAGGEGDSTSADFRITVLTSTLWGIVGIGVIAAALVIVGIAVARFGRR